MSGGHLVVIDRAGRDSKRYSLPSGLVTVGSDSTCDLCMMLPAVSAHHATVVVRANQAVIRNVSDGETLVNGQPISVAALQHGDIITLGNRSFRWEYLQPSAVKPVATQPALYVPRSGGAVRRRGRASEASSRRALDPALQLMLEMRHRHSMPGAGKQVAVVQPQRRDTNDNADTNPRLVVKPHRPYTSNKRQRISTEKKRKSTPKTANMEQTKASLWIESRKSSPRVKSLSPKKTPKLEASKTATPKTASPKTATPKTYSPKTATPKTTPKTATKNTTFPKMATPKTATPRMATPKTDTPKTVTTKSASPKTATPRTANPKTAIPRTATPKTAIPRTATPKTAVPRTATPITAIARTATPRTATPRTATPRTAVPRTATPKTATPRTAVPRTAVPRTATPKTATSRTFTPRTATAPLIKRSSITPKRVVSNKQTPLRTLVLRKAITPNFKNLQEYTPRKIQSVTKVAKIQAPLKIDHTKQAALLLMARHTPQGPTLLTKKTSLLNKVTPKGRKSTLNPKITPQTNTKRKSKSTSPIKRSIGRRSTASLVDLDTPQTHKTFRSSVSYVDANSTNRSVSTVSVIDVDSPQTNISVGRRSRVSLVDLNTPQTNKSIRKSNLTDNSKVSRGRKSTFSFYDANSSQTSKSLNRTSLSMANTPQTRRSTSSFADAILTKINKSFGKRSTSLVDAARKSRKNSTLSENSTLDSSVGIVDSPQINKTNTRMSQSNTSLRTQTSKSVDRNSSVVSLSPKRTSSRFSGGDSISFLEITESSRQSRSRISSKTISPELPSPRKSAMKNPLAKSTRKIESIKFDLSNLENSDESVYVVNDDTLQHSDSQITKSPTRKTSRGSFILEMALSTPEKNTNYSSRTTKSLSNSPRIPESYSIVDLVSVNDSRSSEYGSIVSTEFGTPANTRRSKIMQLVDSSTPFVKTRQSRNTLSKTSDSFIFEKNSPISKRSKSTPETRKSRGSEQNLHASARSVSASPRNSSQKTKSRSQLILDLSKQSATKTMSRSSKRSSGSPEGTHTPENQVSPPTAGTPVLDIERMLYKSPVNKNLKRKTIGAKSTTKPKGKLRSRSLDIIQRKLSNDSSNTSDRTDEGAPRPNNETTITPKSTVKLVPEAVKEKHSTAKKPVSKRSIIDKLNRSDMGKQLFSSPVKRKLSQSMTEFSRNELEELPKRTRHTIALTGRSPESLFSNSRPITPEVFVSPLSTSQASPNLSGVKKLYRRNTPVNDLNNVSGVKLLLRTPRTRKSVNNDLTNVRGVKEVFAKSPTNRLSDLKGVKEVFTAAASPHNDLRRVSGVKSLFQSEKKRKQPKNDLTNVSGVKRLFRRIQSPKNDLRNVSGVKRTLASSPKNDLRDVRGVKRMFAEEKSRNRLSDVSGVEELFNESYDSHKNATTDSLFDQLVGKPTVKLTYAKSFNKSPTKTQAKRTAKSLNNSIKNITNNVEEWIEKELQQRFNKSNSVKTKTPKALNRELLKLQTDTIEGSSLLQTSRMRNSGMKSANVIQTSASQMYSAHKLPLKKRSLAERSLDKSVLPIKKRALVHSTPVKGGLNLTAGAELGRVSPIAGDTMDDNLRVQQITLSPKPKSTPKSKTTPLKKKPASPKKIASPEKSISPKKPSTPKTKRNTRISKPIAAKEIEAELVGKPTKENISKAKSPKSIASPKQRVTRGKKEVEIFLIRLNSLDITKKSPIMSPEPKPTRSRRARVVVEKIVTPKRGRKSAPKKDVTKNTSIKNNVDKTTSSSNGPKAARRTRTVTEKVASPKKAGRKAANKTATEKTIEKAIKPRRGRKAAEKEVSPKKTTKKAEKTSPKKTTKKEVKTVTPKNTRNKKVVTPKASPKKTRRLAKKVVTPKTSPVKPRRGRKAIVKPATPNIKVKKTSIAIAKTSPVMKPAKRTRKPVTKSALAEIAKPKTPEGKTKKGNITVQAKGRKRKITDVEKPVVSPKKGKKEVSKISGKKTVTETVKTETRRGGEKISKVEKNEIEITRSRRDGVSSKTTQKSKLVEVTKTATPKKRGRPAAKPVAEPPAARGRKRKSEEPASPKKVAAKKSKATVKAVQSPSPVKKRSVRQRKPVAEVAAPRRRR